MTIRNSVLSILLLTGVTTAGYSQSPNDIFDKNTSITWLGLDFLRHV
ncbi:MAG: hypothetical protein HC859_05080 [Bacteroidia bacterium]|nr:hypothetical protein [Bacteroidia bacterium]